MMVKTFRRSIVAAGLVVAAALVLSGCGRKSDLDPPSMPADQQNVRTTGGKPQSAPPKPDDPFILDPLL
ncbi:LPS translocon maturation chaperone LptM [Rhizobium daejeonense]|nr:lipoprotein [Rhizobium daejeonense]